MTNELTANMPEAHRNHVEAFAAYLAHVIETADNASEEEIKAMVYDKADYYMRRTYAVEAIGERAMMEMVNAAAELAFMVEPIAPEPYDSDYDEE